MECSCFYSARATRSHCVVAGRARCRSLTELTARLVSFRSSHLRELDLVRQTAPSTDDAGWYRPEQMRVGLVRNIRKCQGCGTSQRAAERAAGPVPPRNPPTPMV